MERLKKGTKVMYVGEEELLKGQEFEVVGHFKNRVLFWGPVKYRDGSIHRRKISRNIRCFRVV